MFSYCCLLILLLLNNVATTLPLYPPGELNIQAYIFFLNTTCLYQLNALYFIMWRWWWWLRSCDEDGDGDINCDRGGDGTICIPKKITFNINFFCGFCRFWLREGIIILNAKLLSHISPLSCVLKHYFVFVFSSHISILTVKNLPAPTKRTRRHQKPSRPGFGQLEWFMKFSFK